MKFIHLWDNFIDSKPQFRAFDLPHGHKYIGRRNQPTRNHQNCVLLRCNRKRFTQKDSRIATDAVRWTRKNDKNKERRIKKQNKMASNLKSSPTNAFPVQHFRLSQPVFVGFGWLPANHFILNTISRFTAAALIWDLV